VRYIDGFVLCFQYRADALQYRRRCARDSLKSTMYNGVLRTLTFPVFRHSARFGANPPCRLLRRLHLF
jgi:hypothetical protein